MNYSGEQVLNQCLDRTDPNNPALRTSGGTSTNPIRTDPTGTTAQPVTSTPAAVSSASTSTITVDTTSGGVSLKATGVGAKGVLMTNNGSVDCYISFDGTAVSGATAASHGGHLLKAGGGFLYIDNPGAIVIKGITASSSTVVAVTLFS